MNNLLSVASPEDEKSPFFLKNKEICEAWENFINSKSGIIKGKYSAWALAIKAEIQQENTIWQFDIRKSTMTNPSILLNKKDVHLSLNIKASNLNHFQQSFTIRPRKPLDTLLLKLNSKYKAINDKITLIHYGNTEEKLAKLIEHLINLDNVDSLKNINYNTDNQLFTAKFRAVTLSKKFIEYLLNIY